MTTNKTPLLGKWKASAEWYTPMEYQWRVLRTFDFQGIYDPCPHPSPIARVTEYCHSDIDGQGFYWQGTDGLKEDWTQHQYIYCNPPTPARKWAEKAIATVERSKDTVIIFAAFSIDLLSQVNHLEDYPHVKVEQRIKWIDGKTMQVSTNPSRYNAFILLSQFGRHQPVVDRFCEQFCDMGTVSISRVIYQP
jgi:hypothetical protein